MIYRVLPRERDLAMDYVARSLHHTTPIEFNRNDLPRRGESELARDIYVGKVCELVFARAMLQLYGIVLEVDLKVYESIGIGDDGDFKMKGRRLDLKASKRNSRYLLAEPSKIKPNTAFVLCRIDIWERGESIEIVGWIDGEKVKGNRLVKAGCYIPGTQVYLQSDNYVVPAIELNSDFSSLAR